MTDHPWARLPEESNRWFQRFERFRLMGTGRDLTTAYNRERVTKGLQESAQSSGAWRRVARENRWIERAEAWDQYITEQAAALVEAEWIKHHMAAVEVLGRLGEEGRANIVDFLTLSDNGYIMGFNSEELRARGHLVKKIGSKVGEFGTDYTIELYDGQAALFKLGQHHKLFLDRVEHSGTVQQVEMTMAEWKTQQEAARAQAAETAAMFEDGEDPDA